ncbi:SUKH-4 family immunity protein [Streptomyces endophyticus]|uniref:SUKH-4 family immunity protein n=1 Tax=Streptomyces endophyticus TaxID=714166 RepID=A0ABU6FK60_9ACTN|nr:SUKH-4 family immunity protein [Streptomyces endophyticus]MEB8343982.1 SUKH-4 family immunity protein [Streptomyces endophyticus]
MNAQEQQPWQDGELSARELIGRLVDGWERFAGQGVQAVVDPSGRVAAQVLAAVHERVAGSVLVDASVGTGDEAITEILRSLDATFPPSGLWSARKVPKRPARLILVRNLDFAGRTRTSGDPERLMAALQRVARRGHTVIVSVHAVGVLGDDVRALPLAAGAPDVPTSGLPAELGALALAQAYEVPVGIWQELVAGLTGRRPGREQLLDVADAHRDVVTVVDAGDGVVSFGEEGVARALRSSTPAGERARVHRHLAASIKELSADFAHPDGWAASGAMGRYAATALAAHCVAADAAGDVAAGELTTLLREGRHVAHLAPQSLLEAAEGAGMEMADIPVGSALADAAYARQYRLLPCTQPTWAAWLHFQATVRGDTALADGVEESGIALPWRVRWSHWRPPGGIHLSYLPFHDVSDAFQARLHDRPVLVAVERRDVTKIYDVATGELLSSELWPDSEENDELIAAVRTLTPEEYAQVTPLPDPLTVVGEEMLHPYLLELQPVPVEGLVVMGGIGGLFCVEPASGVPFTGFTLRPSQVSCPYWMEAPATVPHHGPAPRPADLGALFADEDVPGALVPIPPPLLPDGLTHRATREFLTTQGVPSFRDRHGLGFHGLEWDSAWWRVAHGTHSGPPPTRPERFLREVEWPVEVPRATDRTGRIIEAAGPFFVFGTWMGTDVVIDGPSGRVLALPGEDRAMFREAEVVGRSVEDFLAMTSVWLLALHFHTNDRDRDGNRCLPDRVQGLQSAVDPVGAASGMWGVALREL